MSRQKMNQSLIEILYIILYFLYIIFYTCNFNGDGNKTLSFDKYLQMVLRKINPEKIRPIESPRKKPHLQKISSQKIAPQGKNSPGKKSSQEPSPRPFPSSLCRTSPILIFFRSGFVIFSNFLFDFPKNDKQTFLVKYKLFCCVPRCV